MSSEIAIKVTDLSKCYHVYDRPQDRLKQSLLPRVHRLLGKPSKLYFREFWALRNISFEIPKGQTVGIIGQNGSGKSTLLQMICGTLTPSSGLIETHGRVAALLELGSGFNPEFSGRDNVYMNAALLGLEKAEIDERFDQIVAFADIGRFIDEPVKSYSSGMMVRLAFSVQAQIDPDILIVDEALAVGDAKFQAKCFDRLRQLKENGTSILLVTHSTEQIVTHCDRAILLEKGEAIQQGDPKNVTNKYLDLLFGKSVSPQGSGQLSKDVSTSSKYAAEAPSDSESVLPKNFDSFHRKLSTDTDVFSSRPGYNPHEYRWGNTSARIVDFHLSANGKEYPTTLESGDHIQLYLSIRIEGPLNRPILGMTIKTKEGITVCGTNSEMLGHPIMTEEIPNGHTTFARFDFICRLAPGDYFLSLGIASRGVDDVIPHDRRYDSIHMQVAANKKSYGIVDLDIGLTTIKENE